MLYAFYLKGPWIKRRHGKQDRSYHSCKVKGTGGQHGQAQGGGPQETNGHGSRH